MKERIGAEVGWFSSHLSLSFTHSSWSKLILYSEKVRSSSKRTLHLVHWLFESFSIINHNLAVVDDELFCETSPLQWWFDANAKTFSVHALGRTAFLWFSRQNVGGMAGESKFDMRIESVKLFQILCNLGEECSRIYLKQELSENTAEKKWKRLLISVSSSRGGEAAVCRAGKNMSSLSSVTHQLKSQFASYTYICCLHRFVCSSWGFALLTAGATAFFLEGTYKQVGVNCYRFLSNCLLSFIARISISFFLGH